MRIGIDCSLVPGERTGIGQYCYQLVHALSRIDSDNRYLLYPVFYYTFHPHYRQVSLPQTVNMRSAFQRLNIQTQAGQFGNAGRNIARGPAYTNVDLSLVRDFPVLTVSDVATTNKKVTASS